MRLFHEQKNDPALRAWETGGESSSEAFSVSGEGAVVECEVLSEGLKCQDPRGADYLESGVCEPDSHQFLPVYGADDDEHPGASLHS